MSPALIILLVCFTMVMFLWLLMNLGAVGTTENVARASPWLAFFALRVPLPWDCRVFVRQWVHQTDALRI